MQPGVFVAVAQLECPASCTPISVEIYPHLLAQSTPLWVAAQPREPGVWTAMSAMAMRALSFFRDRAQASTQPYPGAHTLSPLLFIPQRSVHPCVLQPLLQSYHHLCRAVRMVR
jgi:hypothetical protein